MMFEAFILPDLLMSYAVLFSMRGSLLSKTSELHVRMVLNGSCDSLCGMMRITGFGVGR